MPISTKKFNTFTFNHAAQPDQLYNVKTSTEVKTSFDSRAEQVRVALVGLIDNLLSVAPGDSGASNIGIEPIEGLAGATLYDMLISVRNALNTLSLGAIPDNSLTNAKFVADVKVGSLAALTIGAGYKTSVSDAINYLMTLINAHTTMIAAKEETSDIVTTAAANKVLRLNAFGKFDVNINGDSTSVSGKTATGNLNTTQQTNLVTAINELLATIVSHTTAIASKTLIGTLLTTEQVSLVTALNELYTKLGTPTSYYTANTIVKRDSANAIFANQLFAMAATGTVPLAVFSTTLCSNLNADLLDGYHASDFALMNSEAMHNVTFQNSWVNAGGSDAPAQYYIDTMGVVHLQGLIKNGTIGAVAFTLPAGYRPALNQGFCTISSGNTPVYARVVNDGTVNILTGNNAWVTLNGITFRAGY